MSLQKQKNYDNFLNNKYEAYENFCVMGREGSV